MTFLPTNPFVRLLGPLILGILCFQYVEIFDLTFILLLTVALLLLVLSFSIRFSREFRYRWLFGSAVVLLFFLLGYHLSLREQEQTHFEPPDGPALFTVRLLEPPSLKPNSVQLMVMLEKQHDSAQTLVLQKKAWLYVQRDSAAELLKDGQRVLLQTKLGWVQKAMNPEAFDFARFLYLKGVSVSGWVEAGRWHVLQDDSEHSLLSLARQSRDGLLRLYRRLALEDDELAVLAALTLGYREDIDAELQSDFVNAGAMHVLAVSGLHVGILYLLLDFLLSLAFPKKAFRVPRALLLVLLLWVYALLTGLSPSVIRSVTMFSLFAVGRSLQRRSHIYNTIALSAFLMLLIRPTYLFDVGFQLSYAAVVSIVYFQPRMAVLLPVNAKALQWLRDLMLVSIAAQAGTAPLTLYYFHQFPVYFLLTNLIVIPLATAVLYLGLGYLLLSFVPVLSNLLGILLRFLLQLMNASVERIQELPGAVASLWVDWWQAFLLAGMVVALGALLYKPRFISYTIALSLGLSMLLTSLYQELELRSSSELVLYADRQATHLELRQGRGMVVYTTDSLRFALVADDYRRSRHLDQPLFVQDSISRFLQLNQLRILLLQDERLHRKESTHPLKVDVLIIANGIKPRAEELLNIVEPRICVVDLSIGNWYVRRLQQHCREKGIAFHAVVDRGAYVLPVSP